MERKSQKQEGSREKSAIKDLKIAMRKKLPITRHTGDLYFMA